MVRASPRLDPGTGNALPKSVRALAVLGALCTLAAVATAQAEQMFVIDKVVLNVYAEPNQDSSRVATLETGDAVEALDRQDNYVHVRLPDSREGWVRANFLSQSAPAIVRLKELQSGQPAAQHAANSGLAEEIARLKQQNSALQSELSALQKKAAVPAPVAAPVPAAAQAAPVRTPPATAVSEQVDSPAPNGYLWLWPVALVVTAAVAFVAGYQTLGLRIRRKYGDVKVY